jgi:homoserine kinase type II
MPEQFEQALNVLCEFFDLGIPQKYEGAEGYANNNFVAETAKGRYFIKFVLEHSVDELKTEASFLETISKAGIPIPGLVRNREGQQVFQHDGIIAVVTPFLDGKSSGSVSQVQIASIGDILARLHTIDPGLLQPRITWWHPAYLQNGLQRARKHFSRRLLRELENTILSLDTVDPVELPLSIVHGDLWPENVLFDGDRLVAIVDWEEVTIGFSIMDLAYTALQSCFPGGQFDSGLFETLVQTYEKTRKLTCDERQYFNLAVHRIVCTNTLWLLLRHEHDCVEPEKLETFEWFLSLDLEALKLNT